MTTPECFFFMSAWVKSQINRLPFHHHPNKALIYFISAVHTCTTPPWLHFSSCLCRFSFPFLTSVISMVPVTWLAVIPFDFRQANSYPPSLTSPSLAERTGTQNKGLTGRGSGQRRHRNQGAHHRASHSNRPPFTHAKQRGEWRGGKKCHRDRLCLCRRWKLAGVGGATRAE